MSGSIEAARSLVQIVEGVADRAVLAGLHELITRLESPRSFITLVGETSTGKSTLINGLLGTPLLPVAASPTTAAVVRVSCEEDATTPRFAQAGRDGARAEIDRARFAELCQAPPKDLLRLEVRVAPRERRYHGLEVFDTPGFNSVVEQHQEVLRDFIPQSDVLVFVTGYRTGFNQVDQDLYETARDATQQDRELPVLLVVNRTPDGVSHDDRRILEIVRNAQDSLHREPPTFLVPALAPERREAGELPNAEAVWEAALAQARDPKRLEEIERKLCGTLAAFARETDAAAARRIAVSEAGADEIRVVQDAIGDLKKAREDSFAAVKASMEKLRTKLPAAVRGVGRSMVQRIAHDIDASDKWLGADQCATWLSEHALPFQARDAAKQIEQLTEQELTRLDEELAEIANTAVKSVERRVEMQSDAARQLAVSLGQTVLGRIGGNAATSLLRSLGGVGGTAAGAGNLVKMLVKRVGDVFGVTFRRELYNRIGRVFTKRMTQTLGTVFYVALEVIIYIVESNVWKGQLKEKTAKSVDAWMSEVTADLVSTTIPSIEHANLEGVRAIYDDLIAEQEASLREHGKNPDVVERIQAVRGRLAEIIGTLETAAGKNV